MRKIIPQKIFLFVALLIACIAQEGYADGVKNQGFILNQGQWPDSILSRASFAFGDVMIKKDGIVFFLQDQSSSHQGDDSSHVHHHGFSAKSHVYTMQFRGALLAAPIGEQASSFHVNYIKGNDPSHWVSKLYCYKKIILKNIYPSIDLVLYVDDNGLKYDLFLRENAKSNQIAIDYIGLDGLSIDSLGQLQLKTSIGNVTEQMPIAFVEKNSGRSEPVQCRYQLDGNTVRFKLKGLTRTKEDKLVIDPKLIFATYSGSYSDNWGNTATYDTTGCLYVAGIVFGRNFPATNGSHFSSVHINSYNADLYDPDVAIMKYNPTGQLVYATFLGGGLTEVPTSTIVNKNNELYILGTTSSSGAPHLGTPFPYTRNAYDTSFNGGQNISPLGVYEGLEYILGSDLFVSRLSADGSSLLSSTFIGGSNNDGLLFHEDFLARNYGDVFRSEILLDDSGAVYIASHTLSNDILANRPGYDLTYNGQRDGIIMKLKPDLSDVVWNTYWGGSSDDACYSLQFGANNDIFVVGGTTSNDLPKSTPATVKPDISTSNDLDGFVLRLSKDGTNLLATSYLGTTSVDQSYLVQTDKTGNVYVLGQTAGIYPIVNAPYSVSRAHQFVHKLNSTLTQTIFSTTIGSGPRKIDFVPTAFLVNDCENIFIAGWGGLVNRPSAAFGSAGYELAGPNYFAGDTKNLPTTPNAFQKTTDGSDFYLMVLKKDVESLLYATFFGGPLIMEHVDGGTSRFDKKGIVYESVCACRFRYDEATDSYYYITPDFPVTPGTNSTTLNSDGCNNAVFKFDLSSLKADFTVDTLQLCGSGPVTFTNKSIGGASFIWDLGDGTTSTSATTFIHTYTHPGTYTAQLIAIDETTCVGRDTAEKIIHIYQPPNPQLALDTIIICKGDTAQLSAVNNPAYTYLWSPNQYLTSTSIYNPRAYPPVSQYYKLHIKDNVTQCESTDSVFVMIVQAFADTRWKNITGCSGQPGIQVKNYSDENGFTYTWDFGDGTIVVNGNQQINHSYGEFGDYIVKVTVFNQSCSITDTVHVHIPLIKIPNLFTPNSDGHNDKYVIEGMTDNWKLEVYNRWGNSIYTREPYDQSWDGGDLNGGIYYFLITDPAGNKCKGWVHVMK